MGNIAFFVILVQLLNLSEKLWIKVRALLAISILVLRLSDSGARRDFLADSNFKFILPFSCQPPTSRENSKEYGRGS